MQSITTLTDTLVVTGGVKCRSRTRWFKRVFKPAHGELVCLPHEKKHLWQDFYFAELDLTFLLGALGRVCMMRVIGVVGVSHISVSYKSQVVTFKFQAKFQASPESL